MKDLWKFLSVLFKILMIPIRVVAAIFLPLDRMRKEFSAGYSKIDESDLIEAKTQEEEMPDSFKVGETFEHYVRTNLFPKDHFDLVRKTHSYKENEEDYVESSLEPDYMFRAKESGKEFFVEVKYRSHKFNGKIEWGKYYQLKRYKAVDKKTPTFLLIGIGGGPEEPKYVSFIPMRQVKYASLFTSFVNQYTVDPKQPVDEKLVLEHLGKQRR